MKSHILTTRKKYFDQMNSGIKTLEVRVGYFQIRKIKRGDVIRFKYYGNNKFEVLSNCMMSLLEDILNIKKNSEFMFLK